MIKITKVLRLDGFWSEASSHESIGRKVLRNRRVTLPTSTFRSARESEIKMGIVSKSIGHASVAITEDIYDHKRPALWKKRPRR